MHDCDRLAGYIEQVQNAYQRVHIKNKRQALDILKVTFHNQNLLGALNERLTLGQEGARYHLACRLGYRVVDSWTSVCGSIVTIDSTTAGHVKDKYQVLEIDQLEDGGTIFAVLEHKDLRAENAHNLFWAHVCNDELPRARAMALAMRPLWGGRMTQYYDLVYHRLGR